MIKNLTSDSTFVYKYIVPYLGTLIFSGFIVLSIYTMLLAVIFPIFLLLLFLSRGFYMLVSLSEVSINEEIRCFEIKNGKKKLTIPFKDLRSIKVYARKMVVQLRCNQGRFYFMPKNTGHFFPDYTMVISLLRNIIREHNGS